MRTQHEQQAEAERAARDRVIKKQFKEQERARELSVNCYNELPPQLANLFAKLDGE